MLPFNLDLAKILVILVVALILIGPERLPSVARTLGAAWRDIMLFRERMAEEVSKVVPSPEEVASPLSFLRELPRPSELLAPSSDPLKASNEPVLTPVVENPQPDPFLTARKIGEFPLIFLPADPRLN